MHQHALLAAHLRPVQLRAERSNKSWVTAPDRPVCQYALRYRDPMPLRPFPSLRRVLTVVLLLATPVALSSCGNCADAGLCKIAPDETQPYAVAPSLAVVAPGQTVTMPIEIDLRGISETELLEFGSGDPAAKAVGDRRVLAVFDDGKVVVRWSGVPFTGRLAEVQVTATPDARVSAGPGYYYSLGDRAYIRKVNSRTIRVSPLSMTVAVQPQAGPQTSD